MVDINQYRLSENSFRFEQPQLKLVEDVKKIPWIQLLLISMDDVFHRHYVSLSRVKKMESLFIRDLNEKNIHVDATVVEEMQSLKKSMKLITSFKVLSEPSNYITVYYQNVRSFNKHYSWNCCSRYQYGWKLKRHSWKISSTFSKLYTTNFKTNKRI